MAMTLADLAERAGRDVHAHLDLAETIPVLSTPQPQGDVMLLPVPPNPSLGMQEVPGEGLVLVAGQHEHTLHADPGACRVALARDGTSTVAVLDVSGPTWLLHPEHGGLALAPMWWEARRQEEAIGQSRWLVAD